MKTKTLGFIGGGRITRIFLQAFANNQASFKSIVVSDINQEVLSELKGQFADIQIVSDAAEAARQDIVFIALHPPVIMETLGMIREMVTEASIVVSLAPKISIEKIGQQLGIKKIVRLIPNATSCINEGFNPVCFSSEMDAFQKESIMKILVNLGQTFEVDEPKLEAYAIISAMLPTYFWFQWEELKEIGKTIGLSEDESKEAIYETMLASLNVMFKSNMSFDEVTDLIPVKPIGEHEAMIKDCFRNKLLPLFEKIKA